MFFFTTKHHLKLYVQINCKPAQILVVASAVLDSLSYSSIPKFSKDEVGDNLIEPQVDVGSCWGPRDRHFGILYECVIPSPLQNK